MELEGQIPAGEAGNQSISDLDADKGMMDADPNVETAEQEEELTKLIKDNNTRMEESLKERRYQTALLDMAMTRNIIVCLPTGSGKTFIAVQLTKNMLPDAIANGKIIVFLACSVPLVRQQAKYFRDNISPTYTSADSLICELTGDLNIDKYVKNDQYRNQWKGLMQEKKIFAMTPMIFLDGLNHANIFWPDVELLIVDECHNAVKDHPIASIMKHYLMAKEQGVSVPKVLGLTATIINDGKADIQKIEENIQKIEELFASKAVTYHEYEEVLKYSTSAMISTVVYKVEDPDEWSSLHNTFREFDELIEFVDTVPDELTDERYERAVGIEHYSLKHASQVFASNAKSIKSKLKSVISEIRNVYDQLGPYCAWLAIPIKQGYIASICETEEEFGCGLYSALDTVLLQFQGRLEQLMNRYDRKTQVEVFISIKLQRLSEVLREHSLDNENPICGLVFATQRLLVQVLSWYFRDRAESCLEFEFLKCRFVVGTAGYGMDVEESRITSAKQTEVIERFHRKELNVLFATNVLEEGINVPSCNVVVRFDEIKSYPSFVQSMGRARRRGAKFYVFTEANDKKLRSHGTKVKLYGEFNLMLADALRKNALHPDDEDADDDESAFKDTLDEILPPFCPGGTIESPRITAASAISLVYRYCICLSCDRLVPLTPVSWYMAVLSGAGKEQFKAYLLLPSNAACIDVIEGDLMPEKYLAKRAVFLKACKMLYEQGGLNENLYPTPREIPKTIAGFLDNIKNKLLEDKRKGKPGTNKRTNWYPKKAAKLEMMAPNIAFQVYVIVIQSDIPNENELYNLYNFTGKKYLFGIASRTDLSCLPPFPLFTREGIFTVHFERASFTTIPSGVLSFSADDMRKFRELQKLICCELVGVSNRFFKETDETPFLVIPLKRHASGMLEIHNELLELLKSVNEEELIRVPEVKRRKMVMLDKMKYDDSVLVPWHGLPSPKMKYYVVNLMENMNPNSAFVENPEQWNSYKDYYETKYNLSPLHEHQPLIKVKHVSKQLNFLVEKYDEKSEKKKVHKTLPHLIPEFCNVYPIPASYLLQAKYLPSIFHRVFRYLLASEIRTAVADYFNWRSTLATQYCGGNYWNEIIDSFGSIGKVCPSYLYDEDFLDVEMETSETTNLLDTEISCPQEENQLLRVVESEKTKVSPFEYHYEYVHPRDLVLADVITSTRKMKATTILAALNTSDFVSGHAPPLSKSSSSGIKLIDPNEIRFPSFDSATNFDIETGPSELKIMEALTLSKAHDCLNLERLEVIGDSVLKLVVSTFIFTTYPKWQEGQMTNLRNDLVSNAQLYFYAHQHELGDTLSGGVFMPSHCWLPPGVNIEPHIGIVASTVGSKCDIFNELSIDEVYSLNENELLEWSRNKVGPERGSFRTSYTHSEFGDKSTADAVEALIGAYYLNGGIDSALRVMEWVGLRGPTEDGQAVPYRRPVLPERKHISGDREPRSFVPLLNSIEELLCYKFQDPWLVVEAFTHPSSKRNRVTGGYQRLEFIGDAVLDFLVTSHIYPIVKTPGELTDLKSALVNNVTFGSLAVRYDLHTHLLCNSKLLQDIIDRFVEYQKENGHQVTGHFKMKNDMECFVAEDVEVPKVLGDLFESLAGAVYLDSNLSLDTVWKAFYRLMKNEIDNFSKDVPLAPLRELYENVPGIKFIDPPKATAERISNGMGWKIMGVKVPSLSKTVYGCGTSKKNAKAAAAKCAVRKMHEMRLTTSSKR